MLIVTSVSTGVDCSTFGSFDLETGLARSAEAVPHIGPGYTGGFDLEQAKAIFVPFQRIGTMKELTGSGIGLATVAIAARLTSSKGHFALMRKAAGKDMPKGPRACREWNPKLWI